MTVQTSVRSQNFAGGQGSLSFSFKTVPSHPEHIKVKVNETATGINTDLTYLSTYSVTLATDGIGGTVIVSPTFSTDYTYTVYRDTTKTQESDYDDYNQFPADTLENDLDRLMCLTQEIAEESGRTLKLPITSLLSDIEIPQPEANKLFGWNADATAIENKLAVNADDVAAAQAAAAAAVVAQEAAEAAQAAAEAVAGWEVASQAEAEAGSDNTKVMTPLRVVQSITANESDDLPSTYLDTDSTLSANSDVKIPSQKAIKTYVTTSVANAVAAIPDPETSMIAFKKSATFTGVGSVAITDTSANGDSYRLVAEFNRGNADGAMILRVNNSSSADYAWAMIKNGTRSYNMNDTEIDFGSMSAAAYAQLTLEISVRNSDTHVKFKLNTLSINGSENGFINIEGSAVFDTATMTSINIIDSCTVGITGRYYLGKYNTA